MTPPLSSVAETSSSDKITGELHYQVRGPGAAPYGIGSALLVGGAGLPVALVRVQNMLTRGLSLANRMPAFQDKPGMKDVYDWAHEGIPIDLSQTLPVSGFYDARIHFTLTRVRRNEYHLTSGNVSWTASNDFKLEHDEVYITDSFSDSGSQPLNPDVDKIILRRNLRIDPPTYELDIDIRHPVTISGSSTFVFGPFGEVMSLHASNGDIQLDGPSLALMEGGPLELGSAGQSIVSYQKKGAGTVRGTEVWRDLLDNMVVVNYNLYSQVRADPGGPYSFTAGESLDLDGENSEGDIVSWKWTFAPGSGCDPPLIANSEKNGSKTSVVLLCDTRIILTVEDSQGNNDTAEVVAHRNDRNWETVSGHHDEEGEFTKDMVSPLPDKPEFLGDHLFYITLRPVNGEWRGPHTGGMNVSAKDNRPDAGKLFDPVRDENNSWLNQGYQILQVDDPGGPFDGYYYSDEYSIELIRKTLMNPFLHENGRKAFSYLDQNFYDYNVEQGLKAVVDAYLESIRAHEKEHTRLMQEAISGDNDPAIEVEKMYHNDFDTLKENIDKHLREAERQACIHNFSLHQNPLPGDKKTYELWFPTQTGAPMWAKIKLEPYSITEKTADQELEACEN